jgi:outer membrane protein insertion porin family
VISIGAATQPLAAAAPGDYQEIEDEALADRPIASVRLEGLARTAEQLVRNNLRTAPGQPFDSTAIREDIRTLSRLGQFDTVEADAILNDDGTVDVIYTVQEQPLIAAIQVVGNKALSDQVLMRAIPLYPGGPRDDFLLEQAILRIKELYRDKGFYLAEIEVDESRLKDSGILIIRVVEGPRVRIKEIVFVGNSAFPAKELSIEITTKPYIPFFRKGQLEPDKIIDDVAALDAFYKGNGYVDVRVDSRILLSPDNREAKVVFLIEEGRQYRIRNITVRANTQEGRTEVFSTEQIRDLISIRPGDTYNGKLVKDSIEELEQSYQLMGYINARINSQEARVGETPEVDLLLGISEGKPVTTGLVKIQGNFLTKDKVIRRLIRVESGRPLDGREIELSKLRLDATQLFGDVRVTVQRADGSWNPGEALGGPPAAPGGGALTPAGALDTRDVLVEVKERNTGSFNFGVGLSSDAGVFGEVSMSQNNFDIADWPLSVKELTTARAFRGAGQTMNITLAPGDEVSSYSVSLGEPHLFDTDISANFTGYYRNRFYTNYHEERLSAAFGLGRRLGDVWQIGATGRVQKVQLSNFAPSTAIEVYDDRGPDNLLDMRMTLTRSTINNFFRPSAGSRLALSVAPFLVTNTQSAFVVADLGLTTFLTLDEDFLGRKSVLKLNARGAYIFGGNAPTYEKYYLGGITFRGFQFRTVSPKATGSIGAPDVPINDPVGGSFLVFAGAQYEFPVVGDSFNGVVFLDSGTVENSIDFEGYRASVGFGMRIYIPQLGPAPLAFDFGFPILKQTEDERQLFSFTMALPF